MQINRIANDGTVMSFNARLIKSNKDMKAFVRASAPEENGLSLSEKIIDAFEKHPASIKIKPFVNKGSGLWALRGAISTKFAVLQDVEPAYTRVGAIKNVFRRILDPENKNEFNTLVGKEYESSYDSWWQDNISPIWQEIKTTFRERTFFEGNYDKEFNEDFRNKTERVWKKILVLEDKH